MTRRQVLSSLWKCAARFHSAVFRTRGAGLRLASTTSIRQHRNALYRSAFVLDANILGSIGQLQSDHDLLAESRS